MSVQNVLRPHLHVDLGGLLAKRMNWLSTALCSMKSFRWMQELHPLHWHLCIPLSRSAVVRGLMLGTSGIMTPCWFASSSPCGCSAGVAEVSGLAAWLAEDLKSSVSFSRFPLCSAFGCLTRPLQHWVLCWRTHLKPGFSCPSILKWPCWIVAFLVVVIDFHKFSLRVKSLQLGLADAGQHLFIDRGGLSLAWDDQRDTWKRVNPDQPLFALKVCDLPTVWATCLLAGFKLNFSSSNIISKSFHWRNGASHIAIVSSSELPQKTVQHNWQLQDGGAFQDGIELFLSSARPNLDQASTDQSWARRKPNCMTFLQQHPHRANPGSTCLARFWSLAPEHQKLAWLVCHGRLRDGLFQFWKFCLCTLGLKSNSHSLLEAKHATKRLLGVDAKWDVVKRSWCASCPLKWRETWWAYWLIVSMSCQVECQVSVNGVVIFEKSRHRLLDMLDEILMMLIAPSSEPIIWCASAGAVRTPVPDWPA